MKRADACATSIARISICSSSGAQSVDNAYAHPNPSAKPVESIATASYGRIQSGHIWNDARRTAAVVYPATGCASSSSTETIRIGGSGPAATAKLVPATSAECQFHTPSSTGRIPYPRHSTTYIPLCASSITTHRETRLDVWYGSVRFHP